MARRADRHFLAPHLDHVMGHRFSWDDEELFWLSAKSRSFLNRAIGSKAWVISKSELEGGDGGFFLEGSFFVSGVRKRTYPDRWKYEILAEEELPFEDGVYLDEGKYPWLNSLVEMQNGFHFGFNDLREEKVIRAFEKIEKRYS